MQDRKTLTKALAEQYQRAGKKQKGQILDQFVQATGYHRCDARRLLRNHGRKVMLTTQVVAQGDAHLRVRRKGRPRYGPQVVEALNKLWQWLDYINSKRLAAALSCVVPRLVQSRQLRLSKQVQNQLLEISLATIDRLLKPYRAKHALKGRATTRPGTLLKHQIPIRTFSQWDDLRPGIFEMDLVSHDGGCAQGDHCFTLNLTDVATGWTELAAVPNKAQTWVFEALKALRERLPFDLLGLDSDNGSEFINHHLTEYCRQQHITFTRGRPGRKNDNCYVEQKNWSIVRRYAGYARYDTPDMCQTLNQMYRLLSDFNNFFIPSAKLIDKVRIGSKTIKRYDTPKTPYHRLMDSHAITKTTKLKLTCQYKRLDLLSLIQQIRNL